jgi:DNA-binding NarL/FixJ family response regulator
MEDGPRHDPDVTPRSGGLALDPDVADPWAAAVATLEAERDDAVHDLGERPEFPPTKDKRTLTRRRRNRERAERLRAQHDERVRKEQLVLTVAATGASDAEIALQIGLSRSRVQQIRTGALARLVADQHVVDYRATAMHSLGVMHQALFKHVLAPPRAEQDPIEAARVQVAAAREARQARDQMNRLMGAYPAIGVDVSGTVVHSVDVSVRAASSLEAYRRRLGRQAELAAEDEAVDALPAPALPAAAGNGSAA